MSEESGMAVGASICARLQPRRLEVEEAIFARVRALGGPAGGEDEEYDSTLRTAVSAGVGHGLAGIERGADAIGPIPAALFTEVRQAVRSGIALDTELRRYFAGYTLLCDFVMETADVGVPPRGRALREALQPLAIAFDRIVPAVIGEYTRERDDHRPPSSVLLFERVQKLLGGESVTTDELPYELEDWHVGAIGCGDRAEAALRAAAAATDRRLLLVRPNGGGVWAWLGGRKRVESAEIAKGLCIDADANDALALGEPARGIDGWRLTHQQADAAFAITKQGAGRVVQYADIGLVASISQDRLAANSLQQLYLAPLTGARDGGAALRQTLSAYFKAGRNVSSAASALGVSRQTVGSRLRLVEQKIGRNLESCAPEIEVALRLEAIGGARSL